MNKKGDLNIVEYIIYISFIIVAASFIGWVTFGYLNEKIDTTNLETFTLTKKLVYSESCLAFKDNLGVHKGIIDLQKLTTPRLVDCYTKNNFGYLVKISTLENKPIKSAANLDLTQQLDIKICKNIPQYTCTSRKDLVSYKDGEEFKTGYIEVEVINLVQ